MIIVIGFCLVVAFAFLSTCTSVAPGTLPTDDPVTQERLPARHAETNAELLKAVEKGDVEAARRLLRADPEPDARTKGGALVEASFRRDIQFVRLLLGAGADPNYRHEITAHGAWCTPLGAAAGAGDVDVVNALLDAGAQLDPDALTGGATPLYLAVANKQVSMVERLLDAGAKVDGPGFTGETPLLAAVESETIDSVTVAIVARLVGAGADITATNDEGQSVRDIARASGNAELVRVIESGRVP
jgi:ankyrin repeat protein